MKHAVAVCLLLMLLLSAYAQDQPGAADKVIGFPAKFFSKINRKTADLNSQLTKQTTRYLATLAKRENRLRARIAKMDSAGAKNLFANSSQQYAAMAQKMKTDTGGKAVPLSGEYMANTDSLKGTLSFLRQNQQVFGSSPAMQAKLQLAISQFQQLQARMQDADAIKQYVQNRNTQIKQYLSKFTTPPAGLTSQYQGMQQSLFVYSSQVNQYKQMLNNPDQLAQKALSVLNQLPQFQRFMKTNSQLGGLFGVPASYSSPQPIVGLQTHDQVMSKIQAQVGGSGSPGMSALQANLQSAQSQLSAFKQKLSQLGAGSGDITMPDAKVNTGATRSFLKRLIYGVNFQTTRDGYGFPTVTDLGASVGYLLPGGNDIGVGASYKLGWGNGIRDVAFSSNGVGLRSFLNIKIKSGFSATGGFEYNYTTPFTSYHQVENLNDWTRSGLIGITKSVSVKSRFFKQTNIQLLWDFLSYSQIPRTNPLLLRIGYNF